MKNNGRTIGLLSLDNWRGINLWYDKNELSTLVGHLEYSHVFHEKPLIYSIYSIYATVCSIFEKLPE